MINKMISKLRLPRFVEFISGVFLIILTALRYSSPQAQNKPVLAYLIHIQSLLFLVTIFIILVAARLIAGKPKDYTPFFRRQLQKYNGQKEGFNNSHTSRNV